MKKEDNLTAKQEKAIMALLSEPTVKQAAESAGIGETTLYRWMQEEEFDQAFKDARKKALSHTIARLQQTTSSAVETLRGVMENPDSPASSRVTAAKTVMEMAFKSFEVVDMAEQVEEMQKMIQEAKAAGDFGA